MPITTGTNTPATLSAVLEIGAFLPWASSTTLIILARVVSSPTRVIRTVSEPFTLMLPPVTSLPGAFSTGRLSPVSMDSSTPPEPSSTSPSSGTRSPGRMRMSWPTATSPGSTLRSLPFS